LAVTRVSAVNGAEQVGVLELAGEAYGIEIGRVQEIIRMQAITRVPNGPECIEGVTNLRGRVIPVLDLRKRFRLAAAEPTRRSRIVVAELGDHTVGLVVDGVSEVLQAPAETVEPPSALVTTADSSYLRGVAKLDERLILLLDLAGILTRHEQTELAA
jgi:purine-binding chemotaxis protein CheW